VSRREALSQLLSQALSANHPLRGVIHAAGTLSDATLANQSVASFRHVFASKVDGARNLHQLTLDAPLDFFVLYSSAVSLLGLPGQANYAAANGFLDALARRRAQLGKPALSVSWGVVSDVGLAAAASGRVSNMLAQGLGSLTAGETASALVDLLFRPACEIGLVPIDFRQWSSVASGIATRPVWSELNSAAAAGAPTGDAGFLARLRQAAGPQRLELLEQLVRVEIAAVLRLGATTIAPDAPLTTFGLDSLMGLELRNRLERIFGLRLEASVVWNHSTLGRLSQFLHGELFVEKPPEDTDPDALRALENLGQAERTALIDRELAEIEELLG
jgi:acyl carrier protein